MIHEIARELRTLLETAGVPMPVVDGPEKAASIVTPRERIVVERLRTPEPIVAPKGTNAGRNPVHVFDRKLNAKITIYAQEPRAGALYHEHVRRADLAADRVLAALRQSLVARKNGAEIGAGQLAELEDAKGTPVTNFAVYEIPFFVRRAVEVRTWAGAAAEEGGAFTASTIASTTVVGLEGETPTETGCGA
jgi:hypothetical protein